MFLGDIYYNRYLFFFQRSFVVKICGLRQRCDFIDRVFDSYDMILFIYYGCD